MRMSFLTARVLYAIALAHYAIVYARAWAADSINVRVRLAAENDQLHEECALLREELRIKSKVSCPLRPLIGVIERLEYRSLTTDIPCSKRLDEILPA
jgi:hypothetical protein